MRENGRDRAQAGPACAGTRRETASGRTFRPAIWTSPAGARPSWAPGFPLRDGVCCPRRVRPAPTPGATWNPVGIARHSGPGVPCRCVSGGREPPRHRRLRPVHARSGPCCPPASVRRAAIRGDLTGRAASANASLETITRGSRRTAVAVRGLAGGRREPVRIPVGEAAATCSPAMPDASGDALAGVLHAFRNLRFGVLTGSAAPMYAGSPDRRIAGSPDRRIAGSPDRRIAGSPDRRIAGSPDRRIAGSPDRPTRVRPHGHERGLVPDVPEGSALSA